MTNTPLLAKIERLQERIYWLEMRVKILTERDKEQRKWIAKLTNKNHPARRIAK